MQASAFVYPWDVTGDAQAARRIADLGVERVTLAAAYHSTRALTPRHPRHRVVTAEHSAVLYEPDARRWAGRRLRPRPAGSWAPGEAFAEAAEALRAAGTVVDSWVVLAHNSLLGQEHPDTSVVNAYGDRYPWAPCIARPENRAYLVELAAEAAVRPGTAGCELESLGWYGYAHLHAHDKVGGLPLTGEPEQFLMSLCFCDVCAAACPEAAGKAVRAALEPVWRDGRTLGTGWTAVRAALGAELAEELRAFREETARTLQEAAVAAVRAAAPEGFRVLLHADPVPYHCGANAGTDPAHILGVADGVVVPCTGGTQLLEPFAAAARPGSVLAANFTVVRGMGGAPERFAADLAEARGRGANEVRLYHAGLAPDADLAPVREALTGLPDGRGW